MGVTVRQKATLFIIFLFAIVTAAHAGQYEVTWVYDGDTITAQGPEGEIRVRLMGIDAPETSKKKGQASQPYAQAAKKHLMDLIYGKTVEIESLWPGQIRPSIMCGLSAFAKDHGLARG